MQHILWQADFQKLTVSKLTTPYLFCIDKSDWKGGPWTLEPDKVLWRDKATGLLCLIVRQESSGTLCGYVGVNKIHPWHGKDREFLDDRVEVHGGITYAKSQQPADFCGLRYPTGVDDETLDEVWWLGFDCHHGGDAAPSYSKYGITVVSDCITYKDIVYVTNECERLAQQFSAIAEFKTDCIYFSDNSYLRCTVNPLVQCKGCKDFVAK